MERGLNVWLPVVVAFTLDLVRRARRNAPPSASSCAAARVQIVPEGMYSLVLEGGASFDFYLIPVHNASRDHQNYRIVFN